MSESHLNGKVTLHGGDNRDVLKTLANNSIESVVTDPPYALVFMGKAWDTGDTAFATEFWAEIFRVLKPGGHILAFGGTRTQHRLVCAIEDAGFEIRDQIAWMFGQGFPKSHDVSKGIDRAAGAKREIVGQNKYAGRRTNGSGPQNGDNCYGEYGIPGEETAPATAAASQWQGFGTALKPALEPVCLARKPLSERSIAANVLRWGTGALNIDGCRVAWESAEDAAAAAAAACRFANSRERGTARLSASIGKESRDGTNSYDPLAIKGRWPANVIHDGSDEVTAGFPNTADSTIGIRDPNGTMGYHGGASGLPNIVSGHQDSGSAARFFAAFPRDNAQWNQDHANFAENSISLSSEAAVSALSHAVAASMPRRALNSPSYRAPSTTVTASELSKLCDLVTTAIQSTERRSSHEPLPSRLTLSDSLASVAVIQNQTGIIKITISLLRSNGSADPVTFNITETSAEVGVPDSRSKRFWYSSKADAEDRSGSKHPTVKPVDLMQYLCRLITPPGGTVLYPFAGSGSTGEAAWREGFNCILIEREAEYLADIRRRLEMANQGPVARAHSRIKAAGRAEGHEDLPMFAGVSNASL